MGKLMDIQIYLQAADSNRWIVKFNDREKIMKKYYVRCRSIIYFAILIMAISASCSAIEATPPVLPTPTLEKLRLINGEIDACLLISPLEFESVVGIQVVSEPRFAAMIGANFCRYTSGADDHAVLQTYVTTDATLKKVNSDFSSAVEAYEGLKRVYLTMSEFFKINDIENLGDRAHSMESSTHLDIIILDNNIFYEFVTNTESGIGYEALTKLAEIALQKMPQ